jgi:ribosomal protein S12 methylthiotransferase
VKRESSYNRSRFKGIKAAAISLGCSKNRVDTEEVLGLLTGWGCILTDDYRSADIIFVNTCGFIESAQQESINTLLEMVSIRGRKRPKLVAAGCLVEVYGNSILRAIPEIDGAIGVHSYKGLSLFMQALLSGRRAVLKMAPADEYRSLSARVLTCSAHSVNVKIAEGCSNRCHYCLIPKIRGPYRSRPAEEIVTEISALLQAGTREISLIAQDTTAYGSEQQGHPDLGDLIKMILELKHKFWLRIMYTYPTRIDNKLIDILASDSRICRYLDIPLQHVNGDLLKQMARFYSKNYISELLGKIRNNIPGIALRTTFMVGYPGEKRSQFKELLKFIEDNPFERLGAFVYSKQKGTVAGSSGSQVPRRVAAKRLELLMLSQQDISRELNQKLIGEKMLILVDKQAGSSGNWYYGRTEYQAPEVDGGVYIHSRLALKTGDWIMARIKGASDYDLLAVKPLLLDELPV